MSRKNLQSVQVATAGEALIDLIRAPSGMFEPCLGGAVYNLTRALARQDVDTLYLNPLSRDRFGRQLAAGLRDDGVHLAVAEPVVQVTSLAVVGVDEQGRPDYSFYRDGVADRATGSVALTGACAQVPALRVVCTGGLALSPADANIYLPWLADQRAAGRTVVVDANLRPSVMPDLDQYRSHVMAALQYADIVKVSDEDLECLNLPGANALERATHLLSRCRARFLALTLGPIGASLLTRSGQVFHAREMERVAVVDTVGAGDCFLAGLVCGVLEQALAPDWGLTEVPEEQAKILLCHAIACASLCIERRGCAPPTREEVRKRLEQKAFEFCASS